MTLVERSIAALALLIAAASVYAVLGLLAVVPLPSSVAHLAASQAIGRTRVLVSGYYVTQHFIAMGGMQLPPYVFAAGPELNAPGVHVAPTLPDVKAGRVVVVIDTSTGDGSEAQPFTIHTMGRFDSFVTGSIVGALIALAFAFWLAGTVVTLVRRRV